MYIASQLFVHLQFTILICQLAKKWKRGEKVYLLQYIESVYFSLSALLLLLLVLVFLVFMFETITWKLFLLNMKLDMNFFKSLSKLIVNFKQVNEWVYE